VNISAFLRHVGTSATLKHITSTSYDDDYDEATYTYTESTVHIILQPLSAEDKKQLTGGVLDKATAKAYLAPNVQVAEGDLLTAGGIRWQVVHVAEKRDEYIKLLLGHPVRGAFPLTFPARLGGT